MRMCWVIGVVAAVSVGGTLKAAVDDAVLVKLQVFPKEDVWNRDISKEAVDPASAVIVAAIGAGKPLHPDFGTKYGIPFQLVDAMTPRVMPTFEYADESEKGPYPVPANPLIEGVLDGGPAVKGDRHILCIDVEGKKLYEMWNCWNRNGKWECGSGAIFDLSKNSEGQRPRRWTSADAAGLPIFAGLARYDEIGVKKELTHALRFTVAKTRKGFVVPASHAASRSDDPKLPPMGMRVRLRGDFDVSAYPESAQVILRGLKKYGMILADNGSDWFVSGAPDGRWDDEALNTLKRVKGKDFEVVKMGAAAGK